LRKHLRGDMAVSFPGKSFSLYDDLYFDIDISDISISIKGIIFNVENVIRHDNLCADVCRARDAWD